MGRKVQTFHQLFQKLQICLLRVGQSFYKQPCSGRKVSLGGLRPPTSNPTLKNLKFGTPWASYGCFGDHLSAFKVEFFFSFFKASTRPPLLSAPYLRNLESCVNKSLWQKQIANILKEQNFDVFGLYWGHIWRPERRLATKVPNIHTGAEKISALGRKRSQCCADFVNLTAPTSKHSQLGL